MYLLTCLLLTISCDVSTILPSFHREENGSLGTETANGGTRIGIWVLNSRGWVLTLARSSCQCFWTHIHLVTLDLVTLLAFSHQGFSWDRDGALRHPALQAVWKRAHFLLGLRAPHGDLGFCILFPENSLCHWLPIAIFPGPVELGQERVLATGAAALVRKET